MVIRRMVILLNIMGHTDFVEFPEELFPKIPVSKPVLASEPIPAFQPIPASEPIQPLNKSQPPQKTHFKPLTQQTKWNQCCPLNFTGGAYQKMSKISGRYLSLLASSLFSFRW
jgi:hypothetical protein